MNVDFLEAGPAFNVAHIVTVDPPDAAGRVVVELSTGKSRVLEGEDARNLARMFFAVEPACPQAPAKVTEMPKRRRAA